MKDIAVIGNNYAQGSYQLLGEAFDRVRASLYFAEQCAQHANNGKDNISRWAYRASLSEFKSAFDVLLADFRELHLDKQWERSPFKNRLEEDPLVKILKKTRDLAIHTANLSGNHKAILVQFIDEKGEHPKTIRRLFFDPVKKEMTQQRMEYITDDELEWFNRQAKK